MVLFLDVWSLDPLHKNHVLITNTDSLPKHLAKSTDSGFLAVGLRKPYIKQKDDSVAD